MPGGQDASLALALTSGIGPRAVAALLTAFETLDEAFWATAAEWEERAGLSRQLHREAHSSRSSEAVRRVRVDCHRLGIRIVGCGSRDYPSALAAIHDPPAVLYVCGTLPSHDLLSRAVAIVGTRRPSSHGLSFAYRLAGELAAAGAVVVSGLAVGIDAQAHEAVVERNGVGIAVLAGGLDRIHPPVNQKLAHRLCERGCLISEHPPRSPLHRGHFVGRNRLISGLSRAVAVVEAGDGSGALRTADFAGEQGRSVYAMPGRPGDPRVAGALQLLHAGAGLLLGAADIATELGLRVAGGSRDVPELGAARDLLATGNASFDALVSVSGLSPLELLATLGRLELRGRIRRGPDGFYYLRNG